MSQKQNFIKNYEIYCKFKKTVNGVTLRDKDLDLNAPYLMTP